MESRRGQPKVEELNVGDYIAITKGRAGVIKYKGIPKHIQEDPSLKPEEKEIHFGIELIGSVGKNSGKVKGVQYFECEKNRGMMVKMDRVRKKIQASDLIFDEKGTLSKLGLSKKTLGLDEEDSNSSYEEEDLSKEVQ